MGDFRENSTAAVNRDDLFVAAQENIESYLAKTRFQILRSAGFALIDGPARLSFPGPGMEDEGTTTLKAQRAPDAEFQRANLGKYYYLDLDPTDFGRKVGCDVTRADNKRKLRRMSKDDLIMEHMIRSFKVFCEQIEIKGTSESGGIGNATTPFDSTLCADYTVSSSSTRWDSDGSNPLDDIQYIVDELWDNCRTVADTIYMSSNHRRVLATHPALTSSFGGNVGFGGLKDEQIAEALRLKVYVLSPDYIGDYVTICSQGEPGGDYEAGDHALIYGYDPEDSSNAFGIQMSQEPASGSHGKNIWCLSSAYCDVGWNPIGGRRLADCLA